MRKIPVFLGFAVFVLALPAVARADLIVCGAHSDHPLVPGNELSDVRMAVGLSVSGGQATMTFTNVSLSEAVFKEIVLDTYDDDLAAYVLWDPIILTDTFDVGYTAGSSNGLPGYQTYTNDPVDLLEFQAKAPPPRKGIGVGEMLQVRFSTSLADGADIDDYLAFFDGGDDTAHYTLGFHAISADVVGGESLSGMNTVPEPATAGLIAFGAILSGLRTRRRK